jgi:hypothetical protein
MAKKSTLPTGPAAPTQDGAPAPSQDGAQQPAAPAAAERKFPKGAELARALAAAVALKRITPIDLYACLVFALDEKAEMGCSLTLARGVDLRDTDLTVGAITSASR